MAAGLEMLDGRIMLTKLTMEIVDIFVEDIDVYYEERLEVKRKFSDDFMYYNYEY